MKITNTRAHPHANSDGSGSMCFGNIQSDLARMIAEYELSSAFSLVVAFLETYNPNDAWGSSYKLWPRVVNGSLQFPDQFKTDWILGSVAEGMKV